MFNKIASLLAVSAFIFMAADVSAHESRGDRDRHYHHKHRGWNWDQFKWGQHGDRGMLSQAWQVITHPTEAFATGDVTKNANGAYQLVLESSDQKVDVVFPSPPVLREYGNDLVRYEVFSPRSGAAYSVTFVRDRVEAGLSADPDVALREIAARFETLKDKLNVEMKSFPSLHEIAPAQKYEHDYYFAYQLTQKDNDKSARHIPSMQVAERVVMVGPGMVIITMAGRDIEKKAEQFFQGVSVTDTH